MSTFPVGAKVGGDVSGFVTAMTAGSSSLALFTGSQFRANAALGAGARRMSAFAGAAGVAKKGVTALAGAAAMGAAIKAAKEYQTELIKLNTLVGIQIDQIMAWDDAMKDLAVETGKAPADLARAMFAISSGGARGTEAMELLEQSAKASALGLGDMTAIGRTATAMLQAFGDEGLTAEKAIDILVATTREGNLEAAGLATAFSRVLGPAKALGSNVEDIGAFMATFTRLGGSTEEAATGLLNVFNLLIKPPKDAREAMEGMGIGIDDLRKTIQEDGLMAGLLQMRDAIGDNVDALGQVIPNTRALIGFLNTAGLQAEQYAVSQDAINESLGLTNEGFAVWGDTAEATFTRFTASVKVAGIALGEGLLPPLGLFLEAITPMIQALAKLTDVIVDLGVETFEVLEGPLDRFFEWLNDVPPNMDSATQSLHDYNEELKKLGEDPVDITPFQELQNELRAMTSDELLERQRNLRREISALGVLADRPTRGGAKAKALQKELAETQVAVGAELQRRIPLEEELADAVQESTTRIAALTDAEKERLESIAQIIDALKMEVLALEEGEFAVIAHELSILDATPATIAYAQEQFELVEALKAAARAEKDAERETTRTAKAREREAERMRKQRQKAAQDVRDAAIRLSEDTRLAEMQDDIREVTRISTEMADSIGEAAFRIAGDLDSIGEAFRDVVTDILTQIQRLIIQKTIVEPIVGALVGALAGGVGASLSAGDVTSGVTGFGKQLAGAGIGVGSGGTQALTMGPSVIVQQTNTFAPNFLDARDGARWLRENAQEIMGIVGEGAQRSTEFANALRGNIG